MPTNNHDNFDLDEDQAELDEAVAEGSVSSDEAVQHARSIDRARELLDEPW